MAWDLVLLAVAALTCLYVYLTWTHGYFKERGVTFDPPHLLFGGFKEVVFQTASMGEAMQNIYRKHAGKRYVGYFQLRKPAILIRDPELVKAVLVKDFSSFQDHTFDIDEHLNPLMARNPFFSKGEAWKRLRSQLTPAFTSGKTKTMFLQMTKVCNDLQQFLEKEGSRHPGGIDVKETFGHYTSEVVAACALDIRGNSFKEPKGELRKVGRDLVATSVWQSSQFLGALFFPAFRTIFRIRFMKDHTMNFFRKMVKEAVTNREKLSVAQNDFVHVLLTLKRRDQVEGIDSETIKKSDEEVDEGIAAHAATFYKDALETPSIVLSFAMYELAVNQKLQERVREEVLAGIDRHGGELTYEALQEMPLLEMVYMETMRLHPPALTIEKGCSSPYDLPTPSGGTYTVERGTPVMIPILALHHDPEYYPEPDQFIPERFSPERKASLNSYAFLPFGLGPRQCLGVGFAQTEVTTCIASVLRNFDVRTTSKTSIPVMQDPTYYLSAAKGGVWLDFIKRN